MPHFAWQDCPDAKFDKCLGVVFPADDTGDLALLNYVDGETTVLKGYLESEPGSHLSVTVDGSRLTV